MTATGKHPDIPLTAEGDGNPDTGGDLVVYGQPREMGTLPSKREQLLDLIEQSNAARGVLVEYIGADPNFKLGTHYGAADDRNPKATLLKPGAEQICRMFNTRPVWQRDTDTWEMLGRPEGVVVYVCYIVDNVTGNIIGEGRGADKVGNKGRDVNKAIKIAEKCALVDAALYTFCLSEFFTQDMEGRQQDAALAMMEAKQHLLELVTAKRTGLGSDLTDQQFIVKVCQGEFNGRKSVRTPGECVHIEGAFESYDLVTGEKKGQKKPAANKPDPQPKANGKKKDTPLDAAKRKLWKAVEKARKSVSSSLTDALFIKELTKQEYNGRDKIQTPEEAEHLLTVFKDYDLATGEKIPE